MMEKFRIITLDAERMVTQEIRNKDLQQNPQTCNYEIRLRFDLSRYSADRAIILHTDFQQTNALFWQLSTLLPAVASNDKEGLLEHALAYIDFHSIFHTEDFFDESYLSAPYTLSKEALLKNDKVVHTYKLIKMFERGIELSFDGSTYHRFVAFEKSASMTRHSVISFIDAELQKQLELRLMLGMNLSDANIRVELSKYFSYRGLYLTTSTRVESLKLNEETVVVLSDFIEHIPETEIYTAELQSSKSKKDPASFDYWKFEEVTKSPKINLFDGEGLLSPDCASAINNYLERLNKENKYKFKSAACSFQIRLPFTKGVLHQVDYVKFFVEELGLPEDNLIVEDFFGIKRNLKKAQIILTKSMFKCAVWLKEYCKALNLGDPMKFFFKQFVDYDHALYVVLTDANLQKPSHQEKLNHQFLSTLSLTSENFSALVNRQIESIKKLTKTLGKNFSASNDEEEPSIDFTRDKKFSVLASNNAFFKQTDVKNAVKSMQQNLAFDLGLGKIKVDGTNLWFSCDLLGLLLHIAAGRIDGADKKKLESLLERILQPWHFYMPDKKLSLKNNQPYVLLRNPHLSRNEQVLLHAYVDDKSLYERYFSHLKGVVMVSTKSIAALALGGADYDGDYVKVITDAGIIQAVKSLHTLKGACYTRNLPVIEIPSGIESNITAPPSSVSFEMIVNTFNNQIGHISNLAVKFMSFAATTTTQAKKDEFLQNAAECTILTGLDIDAAKSGRRPTANIKEITEKIGRKRSVFLDSKYKLEELKGLSFFTPRVKDDKGKLTLYNLNEEVLSITKQKLSCEGLLLDSLPQFHESVAYINLLPQLYLEYLKYRSADDFKITPTSDLYFEFERPSSPSAKRDEWKEKLDKEKIKKVKILVITFNVILSLAQKVESWRNRWKSQDRDNFVDVILNIQYDANAVIDGVPVEEAKLEMYSMLEDIVDLSNIEAVLESVKSKKWHLTPQDNRPKKLANILGINELPLSVILLLTNFSQGGYLLLYYALLHVKVHLESDTDAWTTDIAYVEQHNDSTSLKAGLSIAQEDPDQWEEFYKIYSESLERKWTRTVLKNELVKLCHRRLSNIFASNFNEALKYFWATQSNDQSHKFFWNVFSEREILDNLPQVSV